MWLSVAVQHFNGWNDSSAIREEVESKKEDSKIGGKDGENVKYEEIKKEDMKEKRIKVKTRKKKIIWRKIKKGF